MTEFWILGALLLAAALVFVVWPLWRGAAKSNQVVRDAANLEIFRDQIAELDADLANGLLTAELYEQGKRELEARLLDEVKSPQGAPGAQPRNPLKVLALVLAVLIPAASVGMYWKVGNQNAFLPQDQHVNAEGFGTVLSDAALKDLEGKLASEPGKPEDWLLLARSYTQLERWTDAAKAYEKLTAMVPNDAQLWADYADVMAMVHGQNLVGPPTALLEKALAIDPNNPKALALGGAAAMERGDYPSAVRYWEALMKQLPPDSQDAKMLAEGLRQAHAFLAKVQGGKAPKMAPGQVAAQGGAAPGGRERITGTVTLSDAVKAKADPDDTVFVLARAANGPPMPLAVVRKQVKDLPLQFALDDSVAVMPQAKLSDFDQVVVVARVSKSGDALPKPGDLQGTSATVKPGAGGLKISINSVVK